MSGLSLSFCEIEGGLFFVKLSIRFSEFSGIAWEGFGVLLGRGWLSKIVYGGDVLLCTWQGE